MSKENRRKLEEFAKSIMPGSKVEFRNEYANEAMSTVPVSLLDQVRAEKSRISRVLSNRVRELNRVEQLLTNTEAEQVIAEARECLGKVVE